MKTVNTGVKELLEVHDVERRYLRHRSGADPVEKVGPPNRCSSGTKAMENAAPEKVTMQNAVTHFKVIQALRGATWLRPP